MGQRRRNFPQAGINRVAHALMEPHSPPIDQVEVELRDRFGAPGAEPKIVRVLAKANVLQSTSLISPALAQFLETECRPCTPGFFKSQYPHLRCGGISSQPGHSIHVPNTFVDIEMKPINSDEWKQFSIMVGAGGAQDEIQLVLGVEALLMLNIVEGSPIQQPPVGNKTPSIVSSCPSRKSRDGRGGTRGVPSGVCKKPVSQRSRRPVSETTRLSEASTMPNSVWDGEYSYPSTLSRSSVHSGATTIPSSQLIGDKQGLNNEGGFSTFHIPQDPGPPPDFTANHRLDISHFARKQTSYYLHQAPGHEVTVRPRGSLTLSPHIPRDITEDSRLFNHQRPQGETLGLNGQLQDSAGHSIPGEDELFNYSPGYMQGPGGPGFAHHSGSSQF